MEIVITISDEDYQLIRHGHIPFNIFDKMMNGTPLPKGHGRLIDISRIDEDKMEQDNPIICITLNDEYIEAVSLDYLNNLPAIIEADKG